MSEDSRYSATLRALVDAFGHVLDFLKNPFVLLAILVLMFGLNLEEIVSIVERLKP